MCIDNPKYHRNQLLFNVTFVFAPNIETVSYESVVRKLGTGLRNLEVETELLSNLAERPKIQVSNIDLFATIVSFQGDA